MENSVTEDDFSAMMKEMSENRAKNGEREWVAYLYGTEEQIENSLKQMQQKMVELANKENNGEKEKG